MDKKENNLSENQENFKIINDNELLLYTDDPLLKNDNNNSQSVSASNNEEEYLTLDEYYLECARFGELNDLKNAMKDADSKFNVNVSDFNGNTALHMSSSNGFLDVVKYLIEELKVDINSRNKTNSTPISWAALNGQKDVVKYLIEKGADVLIKNNNNKLPSECAYDNGYFEVADLLLTKENEIKKNEIITENNINEEIDEKEEQEKKIDI
jgi:ankyrin repeat protein